MPYAKRRYRKKRGKRSKRVYRVKKSKLLDRKINTLFEKRAQEIAEDVHKKGMITKILRKQWFSPYDILQNVFGAPGAQAAISWSGISTQLSDVHKTDQNFIANVAQNDNPLSVVGPSGSGNENNDGDGLGQGMTTVSDLTRRAKNMIQCTSISIGIRCAVDGVLPADATVRFDGCWLHYWIGTVKDDRFRTDPEFVPQPEELLALSRFGYEAKLDSQQSLLTNLVKKRTILKGKFYMRFRRDRCDVKFKEKHKKLKFKLHYTPESQNGALMEDSKKIILVLRSDIPDTAEEIYKPKVWVYTKLRYTE